MKSSRRMPSTDPLGCRVIRRRTHRFRGEPTGGAASDVPFGYGIKHRGVRAMRSETGAEPSRHRGRGAFGLTRLVPTCGRQCPESDRRACDTAEVPGGGTGRRTGLENSTPGGETAHHTCSLARLADRVSLLIATGFAISGAFWVTEGLEGVRSR